MFHVERLIGNGDIKRNLAVLFIILMLGSCIPIKSNPEINDYQVLNSTTEKDSKQYKPAVFMFENNKMQRSFQSFLGHKLNQTKENRDFKVKIQNQDFVISVLDKVEIEKIFTIEDLLFKRQQPEILKNGEQKNYVAISVRDKIGNDCLKNNSIFQNLVLNYLKELKLEYSTL